MIQKVNLFLLIHFTLVKVTYGGTVQVVNINRAEMQLKTGELNVPGINVKRATIGVAKKIQVSDFLISHLILVTSDFNWLLTLNSTGSC